MAVTATVAAVAGTVYVADKMGDAADAQKAAAERASQQAGAQAQAITDQTRSLLALAPSTGRFNARSLLLRRSCPKKRRTAPTRRSLRPRHSSTRTSALAPAASPARC